MRRVFDDQAEPHRLTRRHALGRVGDELGTHLVGLDDSGLRLRRQ